LETSSLWDDEMREPPFLFFRCSPKPAGWSLCKLKAERMGEKMLCSSLNREK